MVQHKKDYNSTKVVHGVHQTRKYQLTQMVILVFLNVNLSGSDTGSGDTIDSTITFTNTFGTTTTDVLSVNVVKNGHQQFHLQIKLQTLTPTYVKWLGTTMVSMSVSDTEGDTPFSGFIDRYGCEHHFN